MKLLITGAAGQIGSGLAKRLVKSGHDLILDMHELVIETLASLQIPHAVLDLKAWMTDRSKIK